tara:strand:- start:41480 stop:41719 length:240 start_codon:yes stop_codon:yes gene_type:complete
MNIKYMIRYHFYDDDAVKHGPVYLMGDGGWSDKKREAVLLPKETADYKVIKLQATEDISVKNTGCKDKYVFEAVEVYTI